jgi:UDP-glucose 4-epimerase
MAKANVHSLVFSSSATVYGEPVFLPYTEAHPLSPMNVYGHTKLMVEQVLRDLANSNPAWRIALLRYFNPVGAHISGLIGEDPSGVPNNLMPFVAQVAVGKREKLSIFGDDYETVDGTGVRDYIHVDDLASGHLAALDYLQQHAGVLTVNLGTGKGTSVFELIQAFERASDTRIPYEVVPRRIGDLPEYYAQADYALAALGWKAEHGINRMCQDSWRWQSQNPKGFAD